MTIPTKTCVFCETGKMIFSWEQDSPNIIYAVWTCYNCGQEDLEEDHQKYFHLVDLFFGDLK